MPNNLIIIEGDQWRPVRLTDGSHTAIMRCPECMRDVHLNNRTIDAKGIVYPDIICPWSRKRSPQLKEQMDRDQAADCEFRGQVRLEEWPPQSVQLTQPQ